MTDSEFIKQVKDLLDWRIGKAGKDNSALFASLCECVALSGLGSAVECAIRSGKATIGIDGKDLVLHNEGKEP